MPHNIANKPPIKLAKTYIPARIHSAACNKRTVSQLNVEKVVNAPKNPTVIPVRHSGEIVR
jgi:hypothetical protein